MEGVRNGHYRVPAPLLLVDTWMAFQPRCSGALSAVLEIVKCGAILDERITGRIRVKGYTKFCLPHI